MDFFRVFFTLMFSLGCGWFQYWMEVRLTEKRWLLLLQPLLFGLVLLFLLIWRQTLTDWEQAVSRHAPVPFACVLVCVCAGWAAGAVHKKGKRSKKP